MATIEQVARFGALVRETRKAKNMTLAQLSVALEERWKPGYLSNIETGNMYPRRDDYNIPDPLVAEISRVLEIPVVELHARLGRIPEEEATRLRHYRDAPPPLKRASDAVLGVAIIEDDAEETTHGKKAL